MWKTILAGSTALAIAGGTLAYAQGHGPGDRGAHWRPSQEDRAAFTDARIAALHAGLKLTPEQEKNWPALETAMREMAKQRHERFAARANAEPPANPVDRLNLMADAMSARGAALKKVADAAGPLYNSLDDAQKHRFVVLSRMMRPHDGGEHHGRMDRDGRGPGGHRGMMGPDGPRGPAGGEGPSRL
jgi:hypothetical protein